MKLEKLGRPGMASFMFQRLCTWHPARHRLARWIANSRPQRPVSDQEDVAVAVEQLRSDGITMLPSFVDGSTVARIRAHFDGAPLSERFGARRTGFTLESAPADVHVAEFAIEHVLAQPDIVALAHHPRLLDIATNYLGCHPTISNLGVWWSLPTDGSAEEAENYHRDVDDWRFVKFFLYLTDVGTSSGPHRFVRGSHRSTYFLRVRRIGDQEVDAVFAKEDQLSITGEAGDAFMEDTFGLHKGQPPLTEPRLVLQIQYSVNPIPVYEYSPVAVQTPPRFDPYLARLYIDPRQ